MFKIIKCDTFHEVKYSELIFSLLVPGLQEWMYCTVKRTVWNLCKSREQSIALFFLLFY